MSIYKFETYGEVEMNNPLIHVYEVHDNYKGSAKVYILISLGSSQSKASRVIVFLGTYKYTGGQAIRSDVEKWLQIEILKYQV